MVDFNVTCRTCMKRDVLLVDLFGPLKIENYNPLKLVDILMESIPLQVDKDDGLPQNLCEECVNVLQQVFVFKNQALNSENELKKQFFLNDRIKNEDNEYYEESLDCFEYNDISSVERELQPSALKTLRQGAGPHDEEPLNLDAKNKATVYKCAICDKRYTDYEKYVKHESSHNKASTTWNTCGQEFDKISLLKENKNENCKSDDVPNVKAENHLSKDFEIDYNVQNDKFKCSECSSSFQTQNQLCTHLKEHFSNNSKDQNPVASVQQQTVLDIPKKIIKEKKSRKSKEFKCLKCNVTFNTYNSLYSHIKKYKFEDCIKDTKKFKYTCDTCRRVFAARSSIVRHLYLHSEIRPFKCPKCSKCFARQDALKVHMQTHSTNKKYICEYCNKAFTQLSPLKDHVRIHTGESPFLCAECGKAFKNSSNLKQHQDRHKGIKPYSCNLCAMKFCTKGQAKNHMISHTGVRPFKCNECGRSFTKSTSLKKHSLLHLGVKPFACDNCDMRFTSLEHLKRHQRRHTGEKPYRCQYCTRAFTQSYDLKKHAQLHHGQDNYQCNICQAKFRLNRDLRLHYAVHIADDGSICDGVKVVPVMMDLKGCINDNVDNNINKTATDGQITITFNRNILEKDATGDITINIGSGKN